MDVSIIITTYNYASYIEECINSCLNQQKSSLKYEVIVIDDGSTDETPILLGQLNNSLVKKFRIQNSGIEAACNYGFSQAKGDFILRVDADDRLLSNYLQCMGENLARGYDFYYPDYEIIDTNGKVIGEMSLPDFDPLEIRSRGDFLATGTLYSAKILKEFYYLEDIKNSGLENYDLILRLLDAKKRGEHISKKLFSYRRHSLNISQLQKEKILDNGYQLFKRYSLGDYLTNEYHPYILKADCS